MDLFTIIGTCLRRWYVTVPIVALTAWMSFQAYQSVPSVYSSAVSIVVLPNSTPQAVEGTVETPVPDNPYSGSGGPRFAAAVLARNINSRDYRNLVGLGDASDVTFSATASADQPIIRIDATGPTPEVVTSTLEAVTTEASVVLANFQTAAGAPEIKLYRIAPAVPADRVQDVTPSRWRSAGAILVLGAAIAVVFATSLDSALRRWRGGLPTDPDPTMEADPDEVVRSSDRAAQVKARRRLRGREPRTTSADVPTDEVGPADLAETVSHGASRGSGRRPEVADA
ncbi:hypothetical protein DDP54_11425 [Cellulomonas sp. WB94]|uniref:hypothetical protein n=1 Tax=Cellulomonas sp. WB94 TaxID=2173174 RepID=UPI000D581799|nr:hypothetical protein [Cellulomonas sp. WB94]PVU83505.1 hypothetical protein DDP54_11425 [Cellulomonas sp. WB94]